jgi:acyl-CoA thioester hydrolase
LAHEKRIAIRWRDIDAYGHVNQAVYLTFAEEAVDDWARGVFGVDWDYVAARTAIDYRSELTRSDGEAVAAVRLLRVGTKSVTVAVELRSPDGRVAAEIETVAVAIDGAGGSSRALTDEERSVLSSA